MTQSAEPKNGPGSGSDEGTGPGAGFAPLDRSRGFWTVTGYAVVFGLVLAFAALAFLGLVKGGTKLWFTPPKNPGWFSGRLWWVAVAAAAGVLVGVLRRVLRLPAKLPGTMKELKDERVEPDTVLKGGCRLAGFTSRRGQPRARGPTGQDWRRARDLGLGATSGR